MKARHCYLIAFLLHCARNALLLASAGGRLAVIAVNHSNGLFLSGLARAAAFAPARMGAAPRRVRDATGREPVPLPECGGYNPGTAFGDLK